jgi:hypothetical protein
LFKGALLAPLFIYGEIIMLGIGTLFTKANGIEKLFQILWLLILLFIINQEIGTVGDFYKNYSKVVWLLTNIFYILGMLGPVYRVVGTRESQNAIILSCSIFFIQLSLFAIIYSFSVLNTEASKSTDPSIIISAVLSIFAITIGWIVHAQNTKATNRKHHTILSLMESRLSPEYQKQARIWSSEFSFKKVVEDSDVDLFERWSKEKNNGEYTPEEKVKLKSLKSCQYLLNFYEFFAVARRHGDLDDRLLYELVSDIVFNLFTASEKFILSRQSSNPKGNKVYQDLVLLVDEWKVVRENKEKERLSNHK